MPARQHYLRIDTGEYEGVYELKKLDNLLVVNEQIVCKCCEKPLIPVMDIIQWGFWEDTYTTYFVCPGCIKAYSYSYILTCEVSEVKRDSNT